MLPPQAAAGSNQKGKREGSATQVRESKQALKGWEETRGCLTQAIVGGWRYRGAGGHAAGCRPGMAEERQRQRHMVQLRTLISACGHPLSTTRSTPSPPRPG